MTSTRRRVSESLCAGTNATYMRLGLGASSLREYDVKAVDFESRTGRSGVF